jgi:multiple sugar transport system ATP-binding protein
MAEVILENITKIYPGSHEPAVKDVSFHVRHGDFMVLLGPSGCGKSTILRMIAGLESITSGILRIDGKIMNHIPAKDRDIAMVFQSYALYPHMKVWDNLAFGLRRRGFSKDEINKRVNQVAEILGLVPFLNRKPYALSGGQRQRVALGRAIVRDPKVFLFDEPLSNLDAALRVSTRNELVNLYHKLGATIIYVTHDQVEAMTMGTQICIINHGKVIQIGPPMDVYRKPINTFVASFLGSPPMNLIKAKLENNLQGNPVIRIGHKSIPLLEQWLPPPSKIPCDIIFGIRPEDVFLPDSAPLYIHPIEVEMEVIGIETLGAETILILKFFNSDEEKVTARVGRYVRTNRGEKIKLIFDLKSVILFDPITTKAIGKE